MKAGWAVASLADIARVVRNRIDPRESARLPFVGMADVEGQTGRLLRTAPAASVRSAVVHFLPGDVLYGRLRPYLNKVLSADFEGVSSAEFIPLTPAIGVSPRFLQYRLLCGDLVHFASHLNTGDRPRVDFEQLASFPIALPPSQEQRRIVSAIESYSSRLDEAVALLERVQRNLKRYRAAVLRAAVDGRLVPNEAGLARSEGRNYEPASVLLERILGDRRRRWREAGGRGRYQEPIAPDTTDLPELPEGWWWTTVDAVGDVLLGRRRAPEYRGQLHPYLRVANVRDDRIDLDRIKEMPFDKLHAEQYLLLPGDILVSEGQSPELIGQSAIYKGGIEGLCFQSTLHRFRPLPSGPTSEFAQLVFRAHLRSGVFQRYASITTNIAHLVLNRFKAVPFPLPPKPEQDRIVQAARQLLSLGDAIEETTNREIVRCQGLRQSTFNWAFEGRLVNQDPADEPASGLLERIRLETATASAAKAGLRPARRRARSTMSDRKGKEKAR